MTDEQISFFLYGRVGDAIESNSVNSASELTTHITKPMLSAYQRATGHLSVYGTKTVVIPGDDMKSVTFLSK